MIPKKFKEALIRGRNDLEFFFTFFLKTQPHPAQLKWLNSPPANQKTLATGNRWGKGVVQAGKLLHRCIYKIRDAAFDHINDYVGCNLSITSDQAGIIFNHAEQFARSEVLNWCLDGTPVRKPFPIIKFGNGAELWARSTERPQNLWGHVFDFVNFDEPAFEKHPQEIIPLIRTRLLDRDGELNFSGTTNGRNWYFDEFRRGLKDSDSYNPDCYSQTGKTADNPYISTVALKRLFNQDFMSEDQIRQHLDGEFIDFSNAPFSDKAIMNLLQPSLELKEAEEGHFYVTGWDIALKVDFSVGITLDVTTIPFKIVAFQRFSNVGWQVLYDSMRARHNHYRDICYFDATGLAQHIEEHLEDIAPHPIMISKSTGLNSIGKSELLVSLIYGLEQNYIHSPFIKPLIEELRFYRWEDTKLRTDCVIALSMAFLAAKESGFCNKGQYGPNFQATPSVGALSEAGAIAEKFDLRGDR